MSDNKFKAGTKEFAENNLVWFREEWPEDKWEVGCIDGWYYVDKVGGEPEEES